MFLSWMSSESGELFRWQPRQGRVAIHIDAGEKAQQDIQLAGAVNQNGVLWFAPWLGQSACWKPLKRENKRTKNIKKSDFNSSSSWGATHEFWCQCGGSFCTWHVCAILYPCLERPVCSTILDLLGYVRQLCPIRVMALFSVGRGTPVCHISSPGITTWPWCQTHR